MQLVIVVLMYRESLDLRVMLAHRGRSRRWQLGACPLPVVDIGHEGGFLIRAQFWGYVVRAPILLLPYCAFWARGIVETTISEDRRRKDKEPDSEAYIGT